MLKVHILTENTARKKGLIAEHGLSLWIEKEDKKILFDTGQTDVYCHNARKMNIDLNQTDYIILSHGHYDHCGGLPEFPNLENLPPVFIHPDSLNMKYTSTGKNKPNRKTGIPWSSMQMQQIKGKMIFNKEPVNISEGITISGEIPSTTNFEEISTNFLIKKEGKFVHDLMLDEQMLIIDNNDKLTVFLGCSHPGVVNSIKYASKLFPQKQLYALIAGMHLENVSALRLQMTIQSIIDLGIQKVVPLHCTGFNAMCEMKRFLGDKCLILSAGDSLQII